MTSTMAITIAKLIQRKQVATLASLILTSALCAAIILARFIYSGTQTYRFLVWNLFLAWIPLGCAWAAQSFYQKKTTICYLLVLICAVTWLIFFPNSLYVMTDLLHLQPRDNIPHWFDLVMILSFAWAGYLLGIVSLRLMQAIVAKSLGKWASWLFVIATLSLGSLGIYFGRYLRWNSWDLIMQPAPLLASIWARLSHPLAHPRTIVFSLLFSLFFISTYFTISALAALQQEQGNPEA